MATLHQEAEVEPGRAATDTDYAHDPSLSRAAPFAELQTPGNADPQIILSIKYFDGARIVKMPVGGF
ncbi:hypothetical protein [Bradyrhizobium sp. CCGB20]|uniref:hypothetical protein n=1 Tax=Bradyrhizobium sp. CCGB20 TaxID=2949633 RepID=UPI0020B3567A|nr:hypothetical protein [Bradyrhizobium sp. CCGB20]MCP3398801.1 hypothetical protein [Bradyrhizobium sp. CCGB20]